LCEEACARCGIDRPIKIGKLQRYALEQEKLLKMKILRAPAKKQAEQIACIGAGPASVACAAELAKAGYRVTIFERNAKAGGVLTYGISEARLPHRVVDQDLAAVKGLGVRFEYGKEIGTKITVDDLFTKKGFDAVLIGAGLWGEKIPPEVKGTELRNVLHASEFLRAAREAKGLDKVKGKNVVIIGGGDVAIDAAVAAKLAGAAQSMIWYRRTLEEAPANISEILFAVEAGVSIMTNFSPKQILGKVKAEFVEFVGRDKKSAAKVGADFVVFATGQSPEAFSNLAADLKLTEKGHIVATADGATSIPGIFAAGDAVSGGYTVVEAVRDGKLAAQGIMDYFAQKEV
jgi:dihydropyrimidine dehydrogenase (NAD+) subunit PreT